MKTRVADLVDDMGPEMRRQVIFDGPSSRVTAPCETALSGVAPASTNFIPVNNHIISIFIKLNAKCDNKATK